MRLTKAKTAPAAADQSKSMRMNRYQTVPTSVRRAGPSISQYRQRTGHPAYHVAALVAALVLLAGAPAHAANAHTQSVAGTEFGTDVSWETGSITLVAGRSVVCAVGWTDDAGTASTFTDTLGNTYRVIGMSNSGANRAAFGYGYVTTGGATPIAVTVSETTTSGNRGIVCHEFSGGFLTGAPSDDSAIDGTPTWATDTNPTDVANNLTGSAVTQTQNGNYVMSAVFEAPIGNIAGTYTAGTTESWTQAIQVANSYTSEYLVDANGSTITGTFQATTTPLFGTVYVGTIALKEAAAAGGSARPTGCMLRGLICE